MPKVFVIAEAGVNHNGSLSMAKALVRAAKKAGADAVKFQAFRARELACPCAPKARYQMAATAGKESQLQMLSRLELSPDCLRTLAGYCRKNRIIFMASAFDMGSVELMSRLGQKCFKIPSGEITNLPLLRRIGRTKGSVILSSGMSSLNEIADAVRALVSSGISRHAITILQCNSEYPSPAQDMNLKAMGTIRRRFGVPVGLSDHSAGIEMAIAAAALGATVIEKHLTLDRDLPGPDHAASLEPGEFAMMVKSVRNVEKALGDGLKKPSVSEEKNRDVVRKSIVASRDIKKGERFTGSNLTTKRPGKGISPMRWDSVMGKRAKRGFAKDEQIRL